MPRPRLPRLRWMFFAACIALVSCIAGSYYFIEINKIVHLYAAVTKNSAELAEKERSVRQYREMVEFYKTEEGIAHLARERDNLVFPGERVYKVVNTSSDGAPAYSELK
jgi:cell division protein FtsB